MVILMSIGNGSKIRRPLMIGLAAFHVGLASTAWAEEFRLVPSAAVLFGPHAEQRFLVEAVADGDFVGERTSEARFRVGNPNIARVSKDGRVTPLSDGVTRLIATLGDAEATAIVTVRGTARPAIQRFREDVMPVLTKAGCNQGSCHGAAAGKNGFRLSLRGYAPERDYDALTRQAKGRRIHKTSPEQSLMLLKATGAIEHGGGRRFNTDSEAYRIISQWIGAGAPPPSENDADVTAIRTIPSRLRLEPGDTHRILVTATYSDGRTRDVTPWARFGTTDETVATVDENGRLTVVGPGEGAITASFESQVALTTLTVPYDQVIDPQRFAEAPRHNRIDTLTLEKLESLHLPPSTLCDDATFLRRVSLAVTGTLPTVEEVEAFFQNDDPAKRSQLIDQLLESEEYVDYWTYRWSDVFLVSSRELPKPAMWAFYRFIRESVAENRPWDEFARAVLTAKGSTLENGAGNYFVLHRDPIELAENASMAFLGLSLTCARCHNHPMEKWTQDGYYGFANLFGRVSLKDGDEPGEVEVIPASSGEVLHPRRGAPMPPKPLDAEPLSLDAPGDRRAALADWLAEPENPYFAPSVVNRVWAGLFGRGFVDPEDDLRLTNPPSHPELFDWLVADFIENGYDVKHLIRTILNSATFQRSSEPIAGNEADDRFLSRFPTHRLPAEVLLDAINQVTEVRSAFPGYPEGWRSLQLPDVQVANAFLDAFGRPERKDTCSCERSSEPSLAQALHLANGQTLNAKLRDDAGVVARLARDGVPFREVIDHAFKAALGREPTAAEIETILPTLQAAGSRTKDPEAALEARHRAIEDLFWALLTSNEFLFNH